jgi:hypothetical protein
MSKKPPSIADVGGGNIALPHFKISDAGDYVRLHPSDEYWSHEFCFVQVPIRGQKRDLLHLIDEDLANKYLSVKKVKRFRLALASKPHHNLFLAEVPSQNLDNSWNVSMLEALERAKTLWTEVISRKAEGVEGYKIEYARNPKAFPEPQWGPQTIYERVAATFTNRMIDSDRHPSLLRLLGDLPDVQS